MFGVIDNNGIYTDTSATLLGAKQYATRNGFKRVRRVASTCNLWG